MKTKPAHGLWVIAISFFIGFYLAAVPMPGRFEIARPDWVGMLIVFWALVLPERFGVLMSFVVGVFYDTLMGTQLGLYGLVFASLSYLVLLLHARLRMYPLGQQAIVVFLILGVTHVVVLWIKSVVLSETVGDMQIWPAMFSALLWPWVYGGLRALQLRFRVQ